MLDIRAASSDLFNEADVGEKLRTLLPDYPHIRLGSDMRQQVPPESQDDGAALPAMVECRSKDSLNTVRFVSEGFLYSRLYPYQGWEHFLKEALRLWELHLGFAQPASLHRLGLRFINRIEIVEGMRLDLDDYLSTAPRLPEGFELPLAGFYHSDLLRLPGAEYFVDIVKTIQPAQPASNQQAAIIVDIDTVLVDDIQVDTATLEKHLAKLRWLKNKAFFGTLTPRALEQYR